METPLLKLYDADYFNSIIVEELWPIEVDDEYITKESVLPQPDPFLTLSAGFNAGAYLFWIGCTYQLSNSTKRVLAPGLGANVDSNETNQSLHYRIADLQAVSQGLVPKLEQWSVKTGLPSSHLEDIEGSHFESLRANIQVTRLWLQSTLLENLFAIERGERTSSDPIDPEKQYWDQREEICQELLLVLYNVRQYSLEPNGNSLVSPRNSSRGEKAKNVFLDNESPRGCSNTSRLSS